MHVPAALDCVQACVQALSAARETLVFIDDGFRVLNEYRRHLSHAGQPGLGDAFFKWLWDNQANVEHCRQVRITSLPGSDTDFAEFPDDPELATFDPSDRKFVAIALASGLNPPILNASDTDWNEFHDPLSRYVTVQFLCPSLMPS